MMRVTAWDTPGGPAQPMRGGAHGEAVHPCYGLECGAEGMFGVSVPMRMRVITGCERCGRMGPTDAADGRCGGCGVVLPPDDGAW